MCGELLSPRLKDFHLGLVRAFPSSWGSLSGSAFRLFSLYSPLESTEMFFLKDQVCF